MKYARAISMLLLGFLAAALPAGATTPEYLADEGDVASAAWRPATPLESIFARPMPHRRLTEWMRDQVAEEGPFWRDTQLSFKLRTYYYDRQTESQADKTAVALGGWLEYTSGWWRDAIQVGGSFYTSQPLYGPDDRDGTLLLAPGQEAISVLGQAYLKVKVAPGSELRLFRQSLNVPYINRQDSRMVPRTFEAYTFFSESLPDIKFAVSHITRQKKREANSFVSMAESAGLNSDDGLSLAGAMWQVAPRTSLGAITEYAWNYMNTAYGELNHTWELDAGWSLKLQGQATHQQSVGDELDGHFDTAHGAAKLTLGRTGLGFSLAASATDTGAAIAKPFGGSPSYLSLLIKDFDRAGEVGWLAGFSCDLGKYLTPGLSGFANLAHGVAKDVNGARSPDQTELDLTLDYRPPKGPYQNLWLRLAAGFLEQEEGPGSANVQEIRLILNYDLDLL